LVPHSPSIGKKLPFFKHYSSSNGVFQWQQLHSTFFSLLDADSFYSLHSIDSFHGISSWLFSEKPDGFSSLFFFILISFRFTDSLPPGVTTDSGEL